MGNLIARLGAGNRIVFLNGGPLFGISAVHLSPALTYSIYLLIDVLLVSIANVLYFRALQVSPLSLCIPFLAFTFETIHVEERWNAENPRHEREDGIRAVAIESDVDAMKDQVKRRDQRMDDGIEVFMAQRG